jgi:hypothetical protein
LFTRVWGAFAVVITTALVACGMASAATKAVKHPTVKNHAGWKMTCRTVKEDKRGKTVKVKKCTFSKANVKTKAGHGTQPSSGPEGPEGPQGSKGDTGETGPKGPSGVNNPLVYTFSGGKGPDSSDCGPAWANDTYDATFIVAPQADGTYTITKVVKGTFLTIAGAPDPNPSNCSASSEHGGVNGTFYGTEIWSVPATADFNPYASCGMACSPNTTGTSDSSSEKQNAAFQSAFFSGAGSTYGGPAHYDFVYDAGSNGNWIDSSTPQNNTGNITG